MKLGIGAIASAFVAAAVLAGCAKAGVPANPTATPNANITQTEGKVMPGDKLGVDGKTLALTEETIDVSVAGETYHFVLGDEAKSNLGYFNKDPQKPRIMEGTFIVVYYEEKDGQKIAQSIEILESN